MPRDGRAAVDGTPKVTTPDDLSRRLAAEAVGTLMLLAVVVGSGIMGERTAGGNVALALWGNTAATGAALAVLITIFGPVSGAHFNPAVTFVFWLRREIAARDAVLYVLAQIAGAVAGAMLAHLMFDLPLLMQSAKLRTGVGQWTGEVVATFGLVATILGTIAAKKDAVPYAVGLYITSGYWFTSSTSFANPAVTVARAMTDTFSGIFPAHAPAFILCQFAGAVLAAALMGWLLRRKTS